MIQTQESKTKSVTVWSKKTVEWIEGDIAYVSVPFTWNLPKAFPRCAALKQEGYYVRAGGPAVSLLPDYLANVAQIGGDVDAISRHNPEATVTSRGCTHSCSFCAVPIIEGQFRELENWRPSRLVCDNNILAASRRHFDLVIDSLKPLHGVDFNQGLDKRELEPWHIDRLQDLDKPIIRFAWDDVNEEAALRDAISKMLAAGFPHSRMTVYVLIGWNDTPEDALYRLVTLRDVLRVATFPMRYQSLKSLKYNDYVAPGWTEDELKRMVRYWSSQQYFRAIPYDEFDFRM
jgi:hypothetical protein